MRPHAKSILIEHDHFKKALDQAEAVVKRALEGESLILPIFGPTRVGKTELINVLQASFPCTVTNGVKQMPLIRFMTPSRPTRRSLPETLLVKALNTKRYGREGGEGLTHRACELMRIVNTRVIVVEEMQHFVESGSLASSREAADWLKVLAEEMNITLILTGLPKAEEVLSRNEQLRDRAEAVHLLMPYRWNLSTEKNEFIRTIHALVEDYEEAGWRLPDARHHEFNKRVYGSCLGRVGMLFKLFTAAEHLTKDRSITYATLSRAHQQAIGTGFMPFNPFDVDEPLSENLLLQAFARVLNEANLFPPAKQR